MEIALLGSEGLGMSRPGSVLGFLVFTVFFFSIPFLSEVLSCSLEHSLLFSHFVYVGFYVFNETVTSPSLGVALGRR